MKTGLDIFRFSLCVLFVDFHCMQGQKSIGCGNPTLQSIRFLLYTRNNQNNAIQLAPSNRQQLNPSKPLKVIIHGWFADHQLGGLPSIKNAYLTRGDNSVIMIDWSTYSMDLYPISRCYVPKIARLVSDFVCSFGIPPASIHVVGHSLGGQMTGFIGQSMKQRCGEVGRITGLDPAGPLFQDTSVSQRLDGSDASFVQIIHTNQGSLGYWGNCGHADFYVNCGIRQRGCSDGANGFTDPLGIARTLTGGVTGTLCSHIRAVSYMAESINSDRFLARVCRNCPTATTSCKADQSSQNRVIMGEDCPSSTRGSFILHTNTQRPFALG